MTGLFHSNLDLPTLITINYILSPHILQTSWAGLGEYVYITRLDLNICTVSSEAKTKILRLNVLKERCWNWIGSFLSVLQYNLFKNGGVITVDQLCILHAALKIHSHTKLDPTLIIKIHHKHFIYFLQQIVALNREINFFDWLFKLTNSSLHIYKLIKNDIKIFTFSIAHTYTYPPTPIHTETHIHINISFFVILCTI